MVNPGEVVVEYSINENVNNVSGYTKFTGEISEMFSDVELLKER